MSVSDIDEAPSVSTTFNFADADVAFRSSNGTVFRVHRKNLEVCADGFPPPGIVPAKDEIVQLSETSATLELLFKFMYPERHPALDTTPFDVLEPLAEAAEKYQVFSAMNICHIRMRDMVTEHPLKVAMYAAKHDYPQLISEVAPMMISMPAVEVFELLPNNLVLPWVRYTQAWHDVHQSVGLVVPFDDASHPYPSGRTASGYSCGWAQCAVESLTILGAGIHTLRELDNAFDTEDVPECCKKELTKWREEIEAEIANIPKFSTFLPL